MKISVVIPCFNAEEYLAECLMSVANQKVDHLETIVVNDGSTDRSRQILDEWNENNSMQIKVKHTENLGSAHSRNTGIELATGEYIQFLDVDDLLMESKISHQIKLIEASGIYPDIIVGSYYKMLDEKNMPIRRPYAKNPWLGLITSNMGFTTSNLFKRTTLERVGGFNTEQKSSQEYELMFRIMSYDNFKCIFDDQAYTIKRNINQYSITNTNIIKNLERHIKLRVRIKDYIENAKNEKNKELILSCCLNEIFVLIRKLYKTNKESGLLFHDKYIPKDFIPDPDYNLSNMRIPRYYPFIYKSFGFKISENIYDNLSHIKKKYKY